MWPPQLLRFTPSLIAASATAATACATTPQLNRTTSVVVARECADTLVECAASAPGSLQPLAALALNAAVSKAGSAFVDAVKVGGRNCCAGIDCETWSLGRYLS